ncbi:MAG: hypothetical protein H7249_07090 [Chitinophagaceae bacterium]|nr:hypothetical protein [Oligoflexus sp.]
MKKLLVVVGLSAIAMAGKCSSDKSKDSETKTQEEFPVKEESQVPAEEVPSYEQQEEPAAGSSSSTTTPEATPAPAGGQSTPETVPTPAPAAPAGGN